MTGPGPPPELILSENKVRQLSADDLGLAPEIRAVPNAAFPDIGSVADDDPLLLEVEDLLQTYGGVIFTGPPGTSKSWYAARIGVHLADRDPDRIRFIQFHPSYQYEDFVEGYAPKEDGSGFTLERKHLLELCEEAETRAPQRVVLVIDELSRGDPGRIFGEALTYVERSKRGLEFRLASRRSCSIPSNLIFLATMNPQDRGVDDVDAAFERRFGKIRMEPALDQVSRFLTEAGMSDALRARVETFFRFVQSLAARSPFVALGHTYFVGKSDAADLRSLWDHQLSFHFERFFRLDPDRLLEVRREWDKVMQVEEVDEASTDEAE